MEVEMRNLVDRTLDRLAALAWHGLGPDERRSAAFVLLENLVVAAQVVGDGEKVRPQTVWNPLPDITWVERPVPDFGPDAMCGWLIVPDDGDRMKSYPFWTIDGPVEMPDVVLHTCRFSIVSLHNNGGPDEDWLEETWTAAYSLAVAHHRRSRDAGQPAQGTPRRTTAIA